MSGTQSRKIHEGGCYWFTGDVRRGHCYTGFPLLCCIKRFPMLFVNSVKKKTEIIK